MMAPPTGILREWSSSNTIAEPHKTEDTMETPVVATLVETIPRIYRKGNVLFQSAYDQFGQRLHHSLRTVEGPPDRYLRTIPSSNSGFEVQMVYDDVADTGEYQHINGELVQVISIEDDDEEDDMYDQAFQARHGPASRIRRFLNRRGCKTKEGSSNKGHNGTKALRERKGSKDKKLRKQRSNRSVARFPIDPNMLHNEIRIPFGSPCVKPDLHQTKRGQARPCAPAKQKMSRAAASMMEEVNILTDCEVSDLGTDIERDPLSLNHAFTDTDLDPTSSFDDSIISPPVRGAGASTHSHKMSFMNIVEEARNLLVQEAEVTESEIENDTDTEVIMNRGWASTKTKSLPNLNGTRKRNIKDATKKVRVDRRVREYEERLKHVNQLYSQAVTPPRKLRPKTSDESVKVQPRVSSPPQHAFQHSSMVNQPSGRSPTRRRRPRDAYNNTLKVVFVGAPDSGKTSLINALARNYEKPKKSRKSVYMNIETWSPTPINGERQIKFNLWDLPGGNIDSGAHHSTQSLFFSSNSLYVIVWDMSLKSAELQDQLSPDYSYESDYDSDYEEAIMNEKRDHLIERDIDEQVMYWIDILSKTGLSDCAILPVVTFKDTISAEEVDRRCGILMQRLVKIEFEKKHGSNVPQLVFDAEGSIPKLSSVAENGIVELQNCLLDIANCRYSTQPAFKNHFESKLCAVTVSVQEILSIFQQEGFKIVQSQDLLVKLAENPPDVENFSQQLMHDALNFLTSIGTIMYYGSMNTICTRPHYLQDYIILDPRWLSTAISLTFRNDSESALNKMRKATNNKSVEIEKFNQSLPLLSSSETVEIWGHTTYIRKIGTKISKDDPANFYTFLQQLCEHCGIFVPFTVSSEIKKKSRISRTKETFYLLPMLAEQVPAEFWSYKVKESWKTTMCNSYIFPDKVPCSLMDKISVSVVKDLLELAMSDRSLKIQQIMYWKTAMYIKVAEVVDAGRKYHVSEIYLHLIENASPNSVSSKNPSSTGRKLIVSAKGSEGLWGEKIWKLGYGTVLDSVESITNIVFGEGSVKREILCPNCLLRAKPSEATVWDLDEIPHDDECIKCPNGHETHPKLLLGPFEEDDCVSVATGVTSVHSAFSGFSGYTNTSTCSYVNADIILPAVVIVALWDRSTNTVTNIGSGFIADNKKGLIITASHTLFNYDESPDEKFYGKTNATAIIGTHHGNESAVFTYCADVVASDVYHVDGCVLQIKTKFERPVELDRNHLTERSVYPITNRVKQERLQSLKMTRSKAQREQEVRVIGFRQTGEGILQEGARINRVACVNKGYICRPIDVFDHQQENSDFNRKFIPRSEIVVNCATGGGNSGGPFVNESGEVVGILSRADPVETQRCYLTPAVELRALLKEAKNKCKEEQLYLSTYDAMEQF